MDAVDSVVAPIAPLIDRIREQYHPRQIWLFGSRARGDHRWDSDWDLLAVVDDDTPEAKFAPGFVWQALGLDRFRADVVVLPVTEFVEDGRVSRLGRSDGCSVDRYVEGRAFVRQTDVERVRTRAH